MSFKDFKKSLQEGEEAYDPAAWEKLSQRLDTVLPQTKNNFWKLKIASSILLSVSLITGVIFYLQKETPIKNKINISEKEQQEIETIKEKIKGNESKTTAILTENQNTDENSIEIYSETAIKTEEVKTNPNEENKIEEDSPEIKPNSKNPFILPKIKSKYCLNDEIEIYNSNSQKLYVLNENEEFLAIIPGLEKRKIEFKEKGELFFKYPIYDDQKSELSLKKVAEVHSIKKIDFDFNPELIYDKGLPYIELESKYFDENTNWSSDKGSIQKQAEKTKLLVFNKGNYLVNLTQTDENQCVSKKSELIKIEESYNLLAPNAFIPEDLDPRNNRFMPIALQKRDVQFELLIIDPKSGKIVFKSTSAENAWDGIDSNTGEMVAVNKSFIWKVSLKNPEEGEKSEYKGTIVRL